MQNKLTITDCFVPRNDDDRYPSLRGMQRPLATSVAWRLKLFVVTW